MAKKETEPKPGKKAKSKKVVPKFKCYGCGYRSDKRVDDRVCPSCGGRVQ